MKTYFQPPPIYDPRSALVNYQNHRSIILNICETILFLSTLNYIYMCKCSKIQKDSSVVIKKKIDVYKQ